MTNLFKTLTDLYITDDAELLQLIAANLRQQPSRQNGSYGSWMEVMPTRENEAREKIRAILEGVNASRGNSRAVIATMQKVLTAEGCAKLMYLLYNRRNKSDEEIVDEFVDDTEQAIQTFFNGMPRFHIVVEDARKSPDQCYHAMDGRYDIYLEDISTKQCTLIEFPTVDSKIIYLWFLMHPQYAFNTIKLRNNIPYISHINHIAFFQSSTDMEKRLLAERKPGEPRDGFEKFWVDHKGKANKAVKAALDDADIPEWYTIESNRNNGETSLSLPASNIHLPGALRMASNVIKL